MLWSIRDRHSLLADILVAGDNTTGLLKARPRHLMSGGACAVDSGADRASRRSHSKLLVLCFPRGREQVSARSPAVICEPRRENPVRASPLPALALPTHALPKTMIFGVFARNSGKFRRVRDFLRSDPSAAASELASGALALDVRASEDVDRSFPKLSSRFGARPAHLPSQLWRENPLLSGQSVPK